MLIICYSRCITLFYRWSPKSGRGTHNLSPQILFIPASTKLVFKKDLKHQLDLPGKKKCLHLSRTFIHWREIIIGSHVPTPQGKLCGVYGLPDGQQAVLNGATKKRSFSKLSGLDAWGRTPGAGGLGSSKDPSSLHLRVVYTHWCLVLKVRPCELINSPPAA